MMEDARDLLGKTVLVKLVSNKGLEFTGISGDGPFFCKVKAVDQIGIWVENRRFVTVELRDSKGRYIAKEKQTPERHVVNILLPWKDVHTVVAFEDEEITKSVPSVLGEDENGKGHIGFTS